MTNDLTLLYIGRSFMRQKAFGLFELLQIFDLYVYISLCSKKIPMDNIKLQVNTSIRDIYVTK